MPTKKCNPIPVTLDQEITISGPLDVVITNPIEVTPGDGWQALFDGLAATLVAELQAGFTSVTDMLQDICDKLDAGIDVNATQVGTWTVDGEVSLNQATLDAIADNFNNLAVTIAGQPINVVVDSGTITLDPATLAALENITVTVDNTPLDVTGTVNIGNAITIDWTGIQDALNGLLVEITNFSDLTDWLAANTLDVSLNGELLNIDFQPVIDGLTNIETAIKERVTKDWEKQDLCVVDASGNLVSNVGVFTEREYAYNGVLLSTSTVLSQISPTGVWSAYALQTGEQITSCPTNDTYQIIEREICADLEGDGSEYGWAKELQSRNTRTLELNNSLYLDYNGDIRPNAVQTDDCNCPCETCTNEVVTCAVFRQDNFTLQDFIIDSVFPLDWTITGVDGNGAAINENVTTPLDVTWTDNTNIYDDLVAALNAIDGVEASTVYVTNYNPDNAPDIEIKIASDVSISIQRNHTQGGDDVFTISESGGNTTVTAVDGSGEISSNVWHECGTGTQIGNNNSFPNPSNESQLFMILSKLDAASYATEFPDAMQVGESASGNHPPIGAYGGQSVNGWNIFVICATATPLDDSNTHYWISGSPDDYSDFTFTRINPDLSC